MNSTLKKNKICAVIPFYNEEKTISKIIDETLNYVDFVICIDDGSTDNSLNNIRRNANVVLLKNNVNSGKGYSLKKGFLKSVELNTTFTITLDADLQHPPEYIPLFIEKLHNTDIVLGNRLQNVASMPVQRILSNTLTSKLLSFKTKQKIPDSQCGYRGFRTGIINLILPVYNGYEAESEMIVKAADHNLKIDFVNIPAIYGLETSKMQPLKTIKGFIKVLLS